MSNLIPPLLSSSPPPIVGLNDDEEEDDEFGDFRGATDSYGCDDSSVPPSPEKSPSKINLDINRNSHQDVEQSVNLDQIDKEAQEVMHKDFQDRRKTEDENSCESNSSEVEVNFSNSQSDTTPEIPLDENSEAKTDIEGQLEILDEIIDDNSCELQNKVDSGQIDLNTSDKEDNELSKIETNQKLTFTVQLTEPEENNSQKDDDFGDFENHFNAEIPATTEFDVSKSVPSVITEIIEDSSEPIICSYEEHFVASPVPETLVENIDSIDKKEITDKKIEENEFYPSSREDDFDDFSSPVPPTAANNDEEEEGDVFEDFSSPVSPIVANGEEEEDDFSTPVPPPIEKDESEDDFDDFVACAPLTTKVDAADDDFGDFESSDLPKVGDDKDDEDEFGDFGDFSSQTSLGHGQPVMVTFDVKDAFAKTEAILKDIFPKSEADTVQFDCVDETAANPVFNELKDVTETNALVFQWSKSNSQKMFLKALNIDIRNILYGPPWNSAMPRFAANLGFTPLEPVKSTTILTSTTVQIQTIPSPSKNSSQKNIGDIPSAQFDWTGSGLENPLDSVSAEPTATPKLNKPSQTQPKPDSFATNNPPEKQPTAPISLTFDTEIFHKPTNEPTSDTESVKSFELPAPKQPEQDTKSLTIDDFSIFESPKMYPLRETHISSDNQEKPGWLQPTIVTPDLPRKEAVVVSQDDDEFDEFQMVIPEKVNEVDYGKKIKITVPDLSEFGLIITHNVNKQINLVTDNKEHIPTSTNTSITRGPSKLFAPKDTNKLENDDDDEFTEFHSSLPPLPPKTVQPLQAMQPLQPLQPSIQYQQPATINWPNPGVTEDDIKSIEFAYSRNTDDLLKVDTSQQLKPTVLKESSVDDDEWSDFVSVANPLKNNLPDRTATPDLPLSVLNLNHVQPPKQPVPVITPRGLLQTKLSSSMQTRNVVHSSIQQNVLKSQPTHYQPSIISNQFANTNLFQGVPNSFNNTNSVQVKNDDDDDDWSDFVSSQPVPQTTNGFQQPKNASVASKTENWSNANIIMNPTHFESFPSYVPQNSAKQNNLPPVRGAIPSFSAIPDLDFIAPKSRTSKK